MDDKYYYRFACIIFLAIIITLVIIESVMDIIDNECKNSPVEQFRNSEYCEVYR